MNSQLFNGFCILLLLSTSAFSCKPNSKDSSLQAIVGDDEGRNKAFGLIAMKRIGSDDMNAPMSLGLVECHSKSLDNKSTLTAEMSLRFLEILGAGGQVYFDASKYAVLRKTQEQIGAEGRGDIRSMSTVPGFGAFFHDKSCELVDGKLPYSFDSVKEAANYFPQKYRSMPTDAAGQKQMIRAYAVSQTVYLSMRGATEVNKSGKPISLSAGSEMVKAYAHMAVQDPDFVVQQIKFQDVYYNPCTEGSQNIPDGLAKFPIENGFKNVYYTCVKSADKSKRNYKIGTNRGQTKYKGPSLNYNQIKKIVSEELEKYRTPKTTTSASLTSEGDNFDELGGSISFALGTDIPPKSDTPTTPPTGQTTPPAPNVVSQSDEGLMFPLPAYKKANNIVTNQNMPNLFQDNATKTWYQGPKVGEDRVLPSMQEANINSNGTITGGTQWNGSGQGKINDGSGSTVNQYSNSETNSKINILKIPGVNYTTDQNAINDPSQIIQRWDNGVLHTGDKNNPLELKLNRETNLWSLGKKGEDKPMWSAPADMTSNPGKVGISLSDQDKLATLLVEGDKELQDQAEVVLKGAQNVTHFREKNDKGEYVASEKGMGNLLNRFNAAKQDIQTVDPASKAVAPNRYEGDPKTSLNTIVAGNAAMRDNTLVVDDAFNKGEVATIRERLAAQKQQLAQQQLQLGVISKNDLEDPNKLKARTEGTNKERLLVGLGGVEKLNGEFRAAETSINQVEEALTRLQSMDKTGAHESSYKEQYDHTKQLMDNYKKTMGNLDSNTQTFHQNRVNTLLPIQYLVNKDDQRRLNQQSLQNYERYNNAVKKQQNVIRGLSAEEKRSKYGVDQEDRLMTFQTRRDNAIIELGGLTGLHDAQEAKLSTKKLQQ